MSVSAVKPVDFSSEDGRNSATLSLNPVFDLLLACCAELAPAEHRHNIRALLGQFLDWQQFVDAAEHHGLVPRVCENFSQNADLVPAEPLAAIRRLYQSNARRSLWLSRELMRVLAHFQARGIPALPYKGPVLAQSLYGDVAARQFSDLDILIHAHDFSSAKTALLELGFAPGMELTPQEERAHLRSGYEFTFDSPNGRNLLELQWQILPRFCSVGFDMAGFFDRAVAQKLGETVVRSLRAEDSLLALCAHAWKHAWLQLSWLCDISELAKSPDLDWDLVWKQSSDLGMQRIMAVTFALAHHLLRAPLPPSLRSDSTVETFAGNIAPLIRERASFQTRPMNYFRLMASLRERWGDRGRFWWRLALTPGAGEWSTVRLPTVLFPLYRLVRLFRLARRFS